MNKLINIIDAINFDDQDVTQETFIVFNISYFDHYLTPEEYSDQKLVCYSDIKNDKNKQVFFEKISARFFHLYENLYQLADKKVMLIINGDKIESATIEQYNNALSEAMRENPLCGFLFPRLGLYVMTGYDLTHSFYILKNEAHLLDKIYGEIKNAGLFILPVE